MNHIRMTLPLRGCPRKLQTCVAQAAKRPSKSRSAPSKGFGAAPKADIATFRCPCDSGLKYGECCQPYHRGALITTPEYVLRSRYSGFVLEEAEFLATTYHPDSPFAKGSRLQTVKKDRDYSRRLDFQGLQMEEVIYVSPEEATIRLQVRMQDRKARDMGPFTRTEVSTFVKVDGRWLFKSSDVEADVEDDAPEADSAAAADTAAGGVALQQT